MMILKILFLNTLFLLLSLTVYSASVKLPHIFSDNMVLQRDKPIKIWGTSSSPKAFTITFANKSEKVKIQKDGKWMIEFPPMKAGGPYEMTIKSDTVFSFKNILIGDVWICSGQSNMEWSVRNSLNSSHELSVANNENIRSFPAPKSINNNEQSDFKSGAWKISTFENAADISAAAYFFAKNTYESEKVPVGLICSYWGGTQIEAWISKGAIETHPDFAEKVKKWTEAENTPQSFEALLRQYNNEYTQYDKKIKSLDPGYVEKWYSTGYTPSDWNTMIAPGYWEDYGLINFDGAVWMKKDVEIPASMLNKPLILNMERINDFDYTWINGQLIGNSQWNESRRAYYIPPHLLHEGKNTITVRMECASAKGGFAAGKESGMFIREMIESRQPICIPLSGEWLFKPSISIKEYPTKPVAKASMNNNPGCIYNTMIAPVTGYTIKGVIWSQGEANTFRAYQYRSLFPMLINDWRKQFGQGDFPFIFAQLAGYDGITKNPQESYLAELREAQALGLNLPNTGMVVLIDAGEPYDVHPVNKQIAGKRFAAEAKKIAYDEPEMNTSPLYEKMKIEGNKIRIWFSDASNGLMIKGKKLGGFAIAGNTKKFVWANARIENNTVVVWNDEVKDPVAVRYGWANTPVESTGANLYNKEGFPAAPFRTDDFTPVSLNNK